MIKPGSKDSSEQRATAVVHRMLHDFGAPLRHVEGFAQLLVEQLKEQGNDDLAEMALRVQLSGNLAQGLLQSLGKLALKRLGPVESVGLQPLLADLAQRWQGRLKVVVPKELPVPAWLFDQSLLVEALDAICVNTHEYADGAEVLVEVEADAHYLRLRLSNAGAEISPDQVDRILTPFGRLQGRPSLAHPGLGLNLAMQVARLHDGDLTLVAPVTGGLSVELVFAAQPTGRILGPGSFLLS